MKTLYIHIGSPKTGTTALQKFCWQNRETLEHYGYCYPDMTGVCPEWTKERNGHFLTYGSGEGERERKTSAYEIWNKYHEGVKAVVEKLVNYDNVILSDEVIFRATNGNGKMLWKELKADGETYGFTVKIIVYLRRQDEFVASLWNQSIKRKTLHAPNASTKTWEEYLEMTKTWKHLDYFKKLESIAAAFGRENIIVRRYDRNRFFGNSIYADFLNAIGLELTEEFVISVEERNPSLYGNTFEMMRILNGVSSLNEDDRNFMRDVMFLDSEISREQYPAAVFSQEERREFLEQYKESNRRVAREYLNEADSDLFDNTIPDQPKWTADNPYMQQDIIRIMALGFKQLREENEKLLRNQQLMQKQYDRGLKNRIIRIVRAAGRRLSPQKIRRAEAPGQEDASKNDRGGGSVFVV